MEPRILNETEVPGASLNGRRPEQLKIPELKLWLACRRAPTKGKKADLVERCEQKSMRYLYRSLKLIQVSAQLIYVFLVGALA